MSKMEFIHSLSWWQSLYWSERWRTDKWWTLQVIVWLLYTYCPVLFMVDANFFPSRPIPSLNIYKKDLLLFIDFICAFRKTRYLVHFRVYLPLMGSMVECYYFNYILPSWYIWLLFLNLILKKILFIKSLLSSYV
jgi:hypothetical protein